MSSMTEFRQDEWQALRHGRLWPRFLLFPVLAVLSYVALLLHGPDAPWWAQGAWVVATGYCWFCVGGSFHEMAHQTLGQRPRLSIWAGRMIGTILLIPYTAYRETHIRHHAYLNTPLDWELWPYSNPHSPLWFRRIFAWFDIILGVIAGPLVYGRIYFVRNSPLNARVRSHVFREYLAMVAFWGTVFATVIGLWVQGTIGLGWLPLWVAPLLVAPAFNTLRKLTEHLGMASYDPILGTRTVVGENLVTRLCSYFNFEIFVHGPHHRYPRLPHHRLVVRLDEFRRERPGVTVPVFGSYRAAFFDALPCLLRNPGVGVNAGGATAIGHREGIDSFVSDVESEVVWAPARGPAIDERQAA